MEYYLVGTWLEWIEINTKLMAMWTRWTSMRMRWTRWISKLMHCMSWKKQAHSLDQLGYVDEVNEHAHALDYQDEVAKQAHSLDRALQLLLTSK